MGFCVEIQEGLTRRRGDVEKGTGYGLVWSGFPNIISCFPRSTLSYSQSQARYVGIFEQMYLLKRVVKTPKLQFIDSGLLSTLAGLTPVSAGQDRTWFGNVLETFVFGELLKHTTIAEGDYRMFYYRDHDQYEVDVVIEDAGGRLVGVEIKAAATVREGDLRGLKRLAGLAGDKFRLGAILYDGTETMPLGDRLWAAPISTLWGTP